MKTLSKYKQNKLEIEGDLQCYYQACNTLAFDFINKYFKGVAVGCDGSHEWVCDEPGTVLIVNDYYFGMDDIILALKQKVTIKKLFEWYDYHIDGGEFAQRVNFNNWLKGAR